MTNLTHEDIQELRKVFDREYVRITDCNDIQSDNNERFSKNDKNIAITSHDVDMIKKLMWVGVSTGISSVVLALLELILK